jgi:hypothetical protein
MVEGKGRKVRRDVRNKTRTDSRPVNTCLLHAVRGCLSVHLRVEPRGVLVASRGHFSDNGSVSVASRAV